MFRVTLTLVAVFALGACSNENGRLQGVREPCATASGTLLGCDDTTIDNEQEACFRLVHCGAIPLDADEGYVFDWNSCVRTMESLQDYRYDLALACIQNSTCDELKDDSLRDPDRPLCLDFGSQ